ncbi:MAG: S1/P1 nuclease, partial [Bacteroidota bacterium]
MKKLIILIFCCSLSLNASAWWDPGHLMVAMIAYMNLDEEAKKEVDRLTKVVQRDYPYINHFITLGGWPDDLKEEGVRTYNNWHYTNIPYNPDGVALPPQPEINVVWAINQMERVLSGERPRDVDRGRHLGFLVHFVGDLHQPLHSTSMFSNSQPGGNRGGNGFALTGRWRNLHMLWDDGCGVFGEDFNNVSPYGQPKEALTAAEIKMYEDMAKELQAQFPMESVACLEQPDPDFWALESHKLAVRYGYRGVMGKDDRGRNVYISNGDEPSEVYLEAGRAVVRK